MLAPLDGGGSASAVQPAVEWSAVAHPEPMSTTSLAAVRLAEAMEELTTAVQALTTVLKGLGGAQVQRHGLPRIFGDSPSPGESRFRNRNRAT